MILTENLKENDNYRLTGNHRIQQICQRKGEREKERKKKHIKKRRKKHGNVKKLRKLC